MRFRIYFLLKLQPSVSLALPPVGWHSTVEQPWHITTVWAWLKTVVMVKQPGHLTSIKKERGVGTSVYLRKEETRLAQVFDGLIGFGGSDERKGD